MLSFDVEKTMLPSSSPSDLNGVGHSPSPPASQPEVKQEPGDERSNSCSPIIRVCDSPESSMSSPQSPLSTSLYSNYSAGAAIGMPSPHSPPSLGHHMGGLPPNLPPIPNPFLFRPFFSMPLPLLPQLAAAQNAINPPQFTPTSLSAGGNKPLPFSIDNILRTNFQNLAGGFDQKPILPLGSVGPNMTTPQSLATSMAGNLTPKQSSSPPVVQPKPSKPAQPKKKMDIEIPVDLSKTSNEAPKTDADCPPGMVRGPNGQLWPAWVFCTRYSDRPSSGPRARKQKRQIDSTLDIDRVRKMKKKGESNSGGGGLGVGGVGGIGCPGGSNNSSLADDKRPRTAFTTDQLNKLRQEFQANRYLTEERRRLLSRELGLNENQIKIWFQNKRAKLKKASGDKGDLAKMLEAQGLYNHQTVPIDDDEYPGY